MKESRIAMGVSALALVVATFIACSKEKETQQETPAAQQTAELQDYTLAEMIEAISWEDGKAFFENQPVKDYTYVCEKVMNDCDFEAKEAGLPYVISWVLKLPSSGCNTNFSGTCFIFLSKEDYPSEANAMGYFEDDKLVIVPTSEENGFTADGYLAIGAPIAVQYDNIVIQEGIYGAYYDEDAGKYTAVAVDYYRTN